MDVSPQEHLEHISIQGTLELEFKYTMPPIKEETTIQDP